MTWRKVSFSTPTGSRRGGQPLAEGILFDPSAVVDAAYIECGGFHEDFDTAEFKTKLLGHVKKHEGFGLTSDEYRSFEVFLDEELPDDEDDLQTRIAKLLILATVLNGLIPCTGDVQEEDEADMSSADEDHEDQFTHIGHTAKDRDKSRAVKQTKRAAKEVQKKQAVDEYEVVVPGTYAFVSLETCGKIDGLQGWLAKIAPKQEQDEDDNIGYRGRQWEQKSR